jgi:hypothetical protein
MEPLAPPVEPGSSKRIFFYFRRIKKQVNFVKGGRKMKLWELIKKGTEEGLEMLKDGVSVAGKTSRILRRRVELTSVQVDVRKVFTRLGSLAYEFHSKNKQDFYRDEGVKGLLS